VGIGQDAFELGTAPDARHYGEDGVSMPLRFVLVSENIAISILIGTMLVADLAALWILLAN